MTGKAVIVHSLADARAALAAAAATGRPVTLLSAPGAAGFAGVLWFREVIAQAAEQYPEVTVTAVIDCGDRPGLVLASLRHGLRRIRFTGRRSTAQSLAAIAERHGVELITGRLRSLDLLDLTDPEAACREWLATP